MVRLAVLDSKFVIAHKADGKFGDLGDYGEAYLSSHDAGSEPIRSSAMSRERDQSREVRRLFSRRSRQRPDKVRIRYGLQPATVRELVASASRKYLAMAAARGDARARVAPRHASAQRPRSNILFLHMNTQKAPLDDVNCRSR